MATGTRKRVTLAERKRRLAREAAADRGDAEAIAEFIKEQIAVDLRRALAADGAMNQSKLAKAMGCSRQYVSEALDGTTNFTVETLAQFCAALGRGLTIRVLGEDEVAVVVPAGEAERVRRGTRGKAWERRCSD